MILPISESGFATKRIEFLLKLALRRRQEEGLNLRGFALKGKIEQKNWLSVTDLAKPPCALWFSLNGFPRAETDEGTQFGFDTGNILESYILDLLNVQERQIELSWPYSLAPGGRIFGHPDGYIKEIFDSEGLVIECKATGGYSFSKKLEEGPDKGHIEQAFCYGAKLKARFFCIIYANREAKKATAFYKVFAYQINDFGLAKKAVRRLFHERFLPVLMAEKRPAPPEKPSFEFGPRGWRCRPDKTYTARGKEQKQVGYCDFRAICPEAKAYREDLEAKEALA